MKFNFENFNNKKESRREFLKKLAFLGSSFLFNKNINLENQESFCIEKREDWDNKWNEIKKQYEQKFGESFSISKSKNIKIERVASTLNYLENQENKELKDFLKRIVIHHSAFDSQKNTLEEINFIRDFHIFERNFNDIGYHYLIHKNGEVFEGRPVSFVGAHAGSTIESQEGIKECLANNFSEFKNLDNEQYKSRYEDIRNILKKDPDYGSLGIVLLGDFDKKQKVSKLQLDSLTKLLNQLKSQYEIPKDNIIYHREVNEKVVKKSNLTLSSSTTSCPGDHFLNKDEFMPMLVEDTDFSKTKSILLEK